MSEISPIGTAPIEPVTFVPPPTDPTAPTKPAVYLHLAIFLGDEANTVLGDEIFRLVSFSGSETISQPFEYSLELHANDQWLPGPAVEPGWSFDQLLGCSVTFAVNLPEMAAPSSPSPSTAAIARNKPTELELSSRQFRETIAGALADPSSVAPAPGLSFFNGIIADMDMAEPGVYRVTVKPALWKLSLTNHYAIIPQCSIQGAIAQLLRSHLISADYAALDATATARVQDWLQAGESDEQFLQRLMSKARLFYYFRHTPIGHVAVFGNTPSYPDQVLPGGRKLRYVHVDAGELGLAEWDVIDGLRYRQSLGIDTVNANFVEEYEAWQGDDIMWQQPLVPYEAAAGAAPGGANPFNLHKVYQYGCDTSLTADLAAKTYQASQASTRTLSGQAYCAAFRAGYQFGIVASTWAYWAFGISLPVPVRPQLDQRPFVLTKVEHEASMDGTYRNRFEATVADGLVGPFSIQDTQQESVLAVVVGQNGQSQSSAYRFERRSDFDPATGDYTLSDGSADQSVAGAYVVLAPDWPGGTPIFVKLGAYMQSVPSIGSLVLVSRASNETELPELQQVVYSVGSKTVVPSGWTANTTVGSAYSTRYSDGMNISFGQSSRPDLDYAVQVVTSAYQGAAGPVRDSSFSQGASYSLSTAESAAPSALQNLPATLGPYGGASDLLTVNEAFGSSYSRSVGNVQSSIATYQVSYSNNVFGTIENDTLVTATSVNNTTNIGDVTNVTVMNADNTNSTTVSGTSTNTTILNDQVNTTTVNGTDSSTTTHYGDVTNVTVMNANSSNTTTILGNQTNNSTVDGTDDSTTTHNGDVTNSTTINASSTNKNTVTGVSTNHSLVSEEASMRIVGNNNSLNVVGATEDLNITGANLVLNVLGAGLSLDLAGAQIKLSQALISLEMPEVVKMVL